MVTLWLVSFIWHLPAFTDLHVISGTAQGTGYTVKYVGDKEKLTRAELDSIFHVVDLSLSLYEPASLINAFNRDGRVKMDEHMHRVVSYAITCYNESGGRFDITTGGLTELWGFGVKTHENNPSAKQLKKQLSVTGSRHLVIRGDSLIAKKKGVKIDCNGIAQGYTVDLIEAFMRAKGVEHFMVELGGEIRVRGEHPEHGIWRIGLESPDVLAGNWHSLQRVIGLRNSSVTTSGNYRKYYIAGGRMYSHLIDPVKGRPVDNGVIAVTVVAAEAMVADAWDNALGVMGVEKAMQYLQTRNDLQAYMIYKDKNGHVKDTCTPGFKKLLQ
jgi:thiamine biosynthesis lipoprotein